MLNHRIYNLLAALLLLFSSCGNVSKANVSDSISLMIRVAADTENLGKTIKCLADLGDDPAILNKAVKVADAALSSIEQRGHFPLNDEMNVNLVDIVVSNALAGMRAVDARCWTAADYCPALQTPSAAVELADLGKNLEKSGATLTCLLNKRKAEFLPKIYEIFAKYIDREANHVVSSATSVRILLPHEMSAADEIQNISPDCANAVRNCHY